MQAQSPFATPTGAPHDAESDPAQSEAYRAALLRLARLADVAPAEEDDIVAREAMLVNGVPVAFQFEPWSNFIKVFVEVGKPDPADAPALYRYLLSQHLVMPAPYAMVAALHPDTDVVLLYGFVPLPESEEADQGFLAFVQASVCVREALRQGTGDSLQGA